MPIANISEKLIDRYLNTYIYDKIDCIRTLFVTKNYMKQETEKKIKRER